MKTRDTEEWAGCTEASRAQSPVPVLMLFADSMKRLNRLIRQKNRMNRRYELLH